MTTLKEAFETDTAQFPGARNGALYRRDMGTWRDAPQNASVQPSTGGSALFMSETIDGLNVGAHFLDRLSAEQKLQVQAAGRSIVVQRW